jgi:chromosome segregation ATPase
MLLVRRMEEIEGERDAAKAMNDLLKKGVVRRKQRATQHMQAAEWQIQALQNELAEMRAALEEQTLRKDRLQEEVQGRTQQWVEEQVCETLEITDDP